MVNSEYDAHRALGNSARARALEYKYARPVEPVSVRRVWWLVGAVVYWGMVVPAGLVVGAVALYRWIAG